MSSFCKKTQSKNGMWEQRFYTDCKLAPAWGYQVDETASVDVVSGATITSQSVVKAVNAAIAAALD